MIFTGRRRDAHNRIPDVQFRFAAIDGHRVSGRAMEIPGRILDRLAAEAAGSDSRTFPPRLTKARSRDFLLLRRDRSGRRTGMWPANPEIIARLYEDIRRVYAFSPAFITVFAEREPRRVEQLAEDHKGEVEELQLIYQTKVLARRSRAGAPARWYVIEVS